MVHRKFSPEFKRRVVEDILAGGHRMAEVCREHRLSKTLVRQWRKEYAERGAGAWKPAEETNAERVAAERRVAELEAALGRATLEVEFLQRALKRAGLPFPRGVRS
jgi:transposase-like protein